MGPHRRRYELHGLHGDLECYNGTTTRCVVDEPGQEPNPIFLIRINKTLTLELPRRFLRQLDSSPVVQEDTWQTIMQTEERKANGNGYMSNNRTDVRVTMDSLITQLSNVVLKRGGNNNAESQDKAIQDLFRDMDSNHNGELDKKEFFDGCLAAGITISPAEINLIWPGKRHRLRCDCVPLGCPVPNMGDCC